MQKNLTVTYLDPRLLKRQQRNPRTHSKRQIAQIAASIRKFGFLNPILTGPDSRIIAGHGRAEASALVGLKSVPTVRVDHLSPSELRAYVIADNKIAENAGWDHELLHLELKELSDDGVEISLIGFDNAEIDALYQELEPDGLDGVDDVLEPLEGQRPISRRDDLWCIGDNRILCGDATSSKDLDRLLGGAKAQCVFTDPPYNVPIQGHVSGLGRNKHREFAMASGEMSGATFTNFLRAVFDLLIRYSVDGSMHYVCMDWRHIAEIMAAASVTYAELKNLCIWVKSNGGMGSLYRSRHELVFLFKNGTAPHINNVELGRHGRNRSNVWEYAGANSFGSSRQADLEMHPTVKPTALVRDAILDCSNRGDLVLDPFAGSGTTLIAAEKSGRRGYGLELDPAYVDTIIRRFKKTCGLDATLYGDGLTFEQIGQTPDLARPSKDVDHRVKRRAKRNAR